MAVNTIDTNNIDESYGSDSDSNIDEYECRICYIRKNELYKTCKW